MSDSIADLTAEYQEATNFNDSLLLLMGDIYTGLDSINIQEGLLYNLGPGENSQRRDEIRQNLANIKARLAANRQLLAEMEQKLGSAEKNNVVLQRTIEQLKNHIAQQDAKISDMEAQLQGANEQIAELNMTVEEKEMQVQEQTQAREAAQQQAQKADQQRLAAESETNAVYYALGTGKELKNNGLNDPKKGYQNMSYFTKADKRSLTEIPLYSKSDPKFRSQEPPKNSYTIVTNADKTKTLRITDPVEFWKYTKYLVLEVKK